MVLDFTNDAESIRASYEDYYETTILSEGTDPAILYDLQYRLEDFHLFEERELDRFAEAYFTAGTEQSALYNTTRSSPSASSSWICPKTSSRNSGAPCRSTGGSTPTGCAASP